MKYLLPLVFLAGCVTLESSREVSDPGLVQKARVSFQETMRDPASAQFRGERVFSVVDGSPGRAVCGEVNGRNGYGGYTGFQDYMVWFGQDGTVKPWGETFASAKCPRYVSFSETAQ